MNVLKPKNTFVDFTRLNLIPGDIIVSWGSGFLSWIVAFLVWLKDGIWNGPTHNMHVHTFTTIASAEPGGYKEVDLNKKMNSTKRFLAFRFKNMTSFQHSKLKKLTGQYFKKKYDLSMYIIKILRAMIFFIPLMFFLVIKASLGVSVNLLIALLILYFPVMRKLRKWEKMSVACSEAEGELYSAVGLVRGIDDATDLAPHIWLWILLNSSDVELVLASAQIKSKHGKNSK